MPANATISFARGAPSLDIVDVEGLREAAQRAFADDPGGATAYGTAVGYVPLREWIAEKHGVEVDQVIVTNGSMQADAFLFQLLVQAGDPVVVESPTYDRTLLNLRNRGADIRMVEIETDGIDVEALASLLEAGTGPKLAHVIPNFQNPAGYTLSAAKRERLLALASDLGRPGGGRVADLRPHAAQPAQPRRGHPHGRDRDRRHRRGGAREPARGRHGAEARARHPQLPEPGRLHAERRQARAAAGAGLRSRATRWWSSRRPTTARCSTCATAARTSAWSRSRPTASTWRRSRACSRPARGRSSRTSSPTSRTRPATR